MAGDMASGNQPGERGPETGTGHVSLGAIVQDPELARLEAEYGEVGAAPRRRGPRPWLAVLVGLLVPGLGQVHAGAPRRGARLWGLEVALLLVSGWAGLMDHFWGLLTFLGLALALHLYILRDAWALARACKDASPSKEASLRHRHRWALYTGFVLFSVAIVVPGARWLLPVQTFAAAGANMEPALRTGEHLVARKGSYSAADLGRGDIVVYQSVEKPSVLQVGRIVGLPGEVLDLVDKALYVDGKLLDEGSYAHFEDTRTFPDSPALPEPFRVRDQYGPARVPDGQLLILGDNRDHSYDSRFSGPVPVANIRARPLYVYWSPDHGRIGTPIR